MVGNYFNFKEKILKFLNLKLLIMLLFFCSFIFDSYGLGIAFNPSVHINTLQIDKHQKTFTMTMLVYHENDDSNDDNLLYAEVRINGRNYFDVICQDWTGYGSSGFSSASQIFSLYNQAEDTWGIKTYNGAGPVDFESTIVGDFAYLKITCPLLDADLYDNNYTLSFSQLIFEDDGADYNAPFTKTPSTPGWESIAISNFNASNNSCTNVALDWQVDDGVTTDVFMELKAGGNVLSSGQNLYSYAHGIGASATPNDINYELKVGYGPSFKHAQTLSAIGGPPRTGYNNPLSFTINDHTCGDVQLDWNDASTGAETETYLITRITDGATFNSTKGQSNLVISNQLAQQNYIYKFQSVNECGFKSLGVVDSSFLDSLQVANNLMISEISGAGGLKLDWTAGNAQSHYKIIKTFSGGGTETIDNIHKDSTSYTDNNVQACVDYTYRIFSVNDCFPNGVAGPIKNHKIIPGLGNTFANNNFRISKGYFSNRVELEWTPDNNSTFVENFVILRKVLGSSATPTQITSQSASTNFFVDNLTDAGVLYEYFIYGTLTCEGVVESTDTANAIGFRSAFGTITGQVNYTGGIAVENVKIEAQSSSGIQGNSILLNGSDSLWINHSSSLAVSNGLSIEMWVKPNSHSSNFTLVEKKDAYSLKHIGSNYVFEVFTSPTTSQTVTIPDAQVNLSNFNQFSAVLYNDTLSLYLNGVSSNYTLLGGTINASTNNLIIGTNYEGLIDEFRLWNIGKDSKTISQDFSRILSGSEAGLQVYLRMNEGASNYAYDVSYVGTVFNKNHAQFMGSPTWSADIPTAAQLAIATYTNAQGNYIMITPYSGIGETFTITPSYLTHQFSPSTRAIFVGEGSSVHNNKDFEDISSFTVQGSLFYEHTSCAVKDAILKIDGTPVISNGLPVKTDATGAFNIQVPIGNHYITIEKQGHTMSVGRFPATGTYDFQDDLAGIQFKDSTRVKITGRIVGGLKEAQYAHGFGKSKNNIGQGQIILKSQQGNGCFTDTILTNMNTGEFTTYAPPLKYIPSVSVPSNPTINFGVLNLLDYSTIPTETIVYDTLSYDSLTQIYTLDSFKYHHKLDYIHRVDPQIVVSDFNEPTKSFIGEREHKYFNADGSIITRDLATNPFVWPVIDGRTEKEYKMYVQVFELYTNLSTNTIDTVPNVDASLSVINGLAKNSGLSTIATDKFNELNKLKYLVYSFKPGTPNFQENASVPEYSFTKTMEIYLTKSDGTVIHWKPNTFNGTPTGAFSAVYDGTFRATVLGVRSNGQQFVTAGPQIPDYILRDPPGSESTSTREAGTEKNTSRSWSWNTAAEISSEDKVKVGAKYTVGFGVSTSVELKSDNTVGLQASVSGGNSGTESITITNTQEWSTNGNAELPGKGSDLYIGRSKNVSFGISEILKIVPDSLCSRLECVGTAFSGYSLAKAKNLSIVPGGYETNFFYSENHIKNYLIPELEGLRNNLLQSNSRYTSHLPIGDDNYGKNNDDPDLDPTQFVSAQEMIDYLLDLFDSSYVKVDTTQINPLVTENTKILLSSHNQAALWKRLKKLSNPDYSVLSGPSYTYQAITKQDSLTGDSVRWVNNQIKHWENAIMLNEWEKVNIDDQNIRTLLKEKALSDLYNRYEGTLIAYWINQIASGLAGGVVVAAASTPVPGSSYVGAAAFAVATGTGIAAAELQEEYFRYNLLKSKIESKYNQTHNNYSINAGVDYTNSVTHETASSYKTEVEYGMSTSLKTEIEGTISNTGVGFEKTISLGFTSGREWEKETTSTESVSFTLSDPDQGDYFSVDVYSSLMGWGPIFKLKPGGQTSCPHEDVALTEYYVEDPNNLNSNNPHSPNYELSARTKQREKPAITAAPSILTNIPVNDAAVFNLTIDNLSESVDDMTYKVELVSSSNPFGAIVKIDGFQPFTDVTIPGGTSINKVLTIEKGAGPVYNYDSLLIIVRSKCQYEAATSDGVDIVDSAYVSAHFLPTCTDVNFATPDDQWVLNNSFQDTLPIGILDYNINFFDFESIKLQYKPSSQAQWIGLKTFYKDTSGLLNQTPIPTNTPFTLWDWETDQIVDGNYDLRLVTHCTLADVISPTHSGVVDRINPHPFGTPSPADGILDPNDDIKIRFNEPVDLGSLTSLNFDVRGVLNGTETTHASNLYFDGVDDYVEVVAGIPVQNRDFTLEFSVKRAGTGQEVILSQGSDANEQIYVGFNSANQLEFAINGQSITSTVAYTDNNWHYFAVAYNYANETAEMFEASASTTAALINNGNTSIYTKYNGADKFNIGKSVASNSYFNGNIDDVRIWNTTRTLSEFALLKSKMLSSKELGLLYNWRFDEADGIFAEDHVRARNGKIYGAEWTVEPGGNAISFDGVDDYLKINKGDVNITKGMDFTLEFWFNSTQSGAATLVSNGSGTGLSSDSLYSWNIAKDAAGKIHVYHNGNDFVAVDSNYFNGEWHHFALVLNRLGNLTAYIDGNLQNSVQALPYKELGGSGMYLGARGFYIGIVENFDSYFNGQIDEFRFWDASRKYEQIDRDKQNRMKGDEFALRLYMPFENYALDPTGIPILSPSIAEQIDSVNHAVLNPNGATIVNTAPRIKLPRPVQSIAFTYSVNNDEIIITPTTASAMIENVTLDITVKRVKDLHGNYMESPKTWIAYVDKNQVVWQDDALSFNKSFGDTLNFSSAIVNSGGATKTFTIENIPNWLTVTPTSGTITPNSTMPVQMTADPLMNIGDYVQDIRLLTDFGFPEQLTINIKVREQAPNWAVNPADYINSMSIIGYLKINDVVSTSAEDKLGVFVNGECRGVAHLEYVPLLDRYLVFLDVYSNLNSGEALEFRIWDASSGTVFSDIVPGNLSFVANSLIGSVNAPQLFETNYEIAVELPLNTGWNWISNFLYNTDSTNLDATLESLESVDADEIKGQAEYSNYLNGTGWVGALNNVGIVPEAGYKLKISQTDTLVLKGDVLDPTTRTIGLVQGWNWIGFISLRNQNITSALGNLNPTDGDIIKAKTQFAVYNNLLGWVGSLQTMIPGQGYMYQSAANTSFVYPAVGQFKSGMINAENLYTNKQWAVNHGAFAGNMTSIATLDTECDYVLDNNNLTLGVFDATDNCRAVNKIELLEENRVSFLTIAGDLSENLKFSILDNNTGKVFELEEQLAFTANEHIGTVNNPVSLKVSNEMCFKMQLAQANDEDEGGIANVNEQEGKLFQVYPTIFENKVGVYYLAQNEEKEAEIVMYNLLGQEVLTQKIVQKEGINAIEVDLSKQELAKGVYHLVLNSGDITHSVKIVKK